MRAGLGHVEDRRDAIHQAAVPTLGPVARGIGRDGVPTLPGDAFRYCLLVRTG
jgi:hypothetical protein